VPEPPETDGAGFGSLELDIVMKYAGAPAVVIDVIRRNASDGIVCLAGLSSGSHKMNFDFGDLNRTMAMKNDVVFGTVNTNRSHYEMAADPGKKPQGLAPPHDHTPGCAAPLERSRTGDIKVGPDFGE
jgi:hypothetical protein